MARHVRAMLELRERGAVVFDYGNNIRPHAAGGGRRRTRSAIDIFTARYLRPLFSRGIGPFRWICVSGDDRDLDVIDELCSELFADVAADHATGSSSPARTSAARACRRGSPGSATASAPRWRSPSTRPSPTAGCADRSRSPATTWTRAR